MRNSRIISKVIGFRELVDERFQSGDLFVAQFFFDETAVAAGDFHDVSMIVKLRVSLLIIPSHEICSGYADRFRDFFQPVERDIRYFSNFVFINSLLSGATFSAELFLCAVCRFACGLDSFSDCHCNVTFLGL